MYIFKQSWTLSLSTIGQNNNNKKTNKQLAPPQTNAIGWANVAICQAGRVETNRAMFWKYNTYEWLTLKNLTFKT